jgi:hypothetical protein
MRKINPFPHFTHSLTSHLNSAVNKFLLVKLSFSLSLIFECVCVCLCVWVEYVNILIYTHISHNHKHTRIQQHYELTVSPGCTGCTFCIVGCGHVIFLGFFVPGPYFCKQPFPVCLMYWFSICVRTRVFVLWNLPS